MLDPGPKPVSQTSRDRQPHAVVIGSGFGGLAAAVRLGAKGYRVTVLEKLDAPGGRAYVYKQDGFTFDAGPTIVTAPYLFEELWKLCGKRLGDDVTLVPMKPFYRIRFNDGSVFDYSDDKEAVLRQIAQFCPEDVDGYDRFMKASEAIFKVGFEQLGDMPFNNFTDMVKIAPDMIKLESYRSVYSLVSKYFRDPRLRMVFSFHPLLVGGNPFSATSVYCLITFLERQWGVHFAMGGTGRLITGLVGLIEGQGNKVLCGQDVREIVVENGAARGVRLASGEIVEADIVVSNADSASTYRYLLPASVRSRWTDRKIEKARYSMSLFLWYFGTKRRYDDVKHHTILMGPRYKELVTDIFKRKICADDFSLYLHRPTATDPSLAPEGCDTFYVLSPVPHMQSGIDWQVKAESYRKLIAQSLSDTVLPDLENQVVSSRMLTPQDFQDRLSSFRGAAFGLEPVLTQSAWFRPHNLSEDVDRLYLVGAGTHPGAGLPGVLSSARVLDSLVPDAHDLVST
ncbi:MULTISPECIES: phytoene desaturase [Rhodopseudomonas]|uniref:Phytoene dehydrogenase n=1 Tax=Rhodopseudomonas palustris TaxID=1076 RepID=A0A0D7DYI4_RHOPL|nr:MULTISPECIES: phytoene desaturase [Rhodopseudomonas]KIZ33235.1 phytoene dehydrogenase [Rhodopseudomonas palustris]MDF3809662.1 phytoene desaturase [Rhodopseudomonas sp. BAL398]WOK17853.1 phytoene desaturase [Rhodopseudomonas sp. BAL398]